MNIAVITGASSGIGKEFVRQISARENYDEIWVIARREALLSDLSTIVSTPIRSIALDLTSQKSFQDLENRLREENPSIRYFVHAAGFGKMGTYSQVTQQDCTDMIRLNCVAAVQMTNLLLPYMSEGSNIIEVCSSSAFQPLPGLNVYAATKAFLLQYSRGLRWELFPRGINVTALCPYWVKDTEFIRISRENAEGTAVRHFPLAGSKRDAVCKALTDSRLGKAVSTPGPVAPMQRIAAKLLPIGAVTAIWELVRRL